MPWWNPFKKSEQEVLTDRLTERSVDITTNSRRTDPQSETKLAAAKKEYLEITVALIKLEGPPYEESLKRQDWYNAKTGENIVIVKEETE